MQVEEGVPGRLVVRLIARKSSGSYGISAGLAREDGALTSTTSTLRRRTYLLNNQAAGLSGFDRTRTLKPLQHAGSMTSINPRAGWDKVGDQFYRRVKLYDAVFDQDIELENYIVVGAPYSGAIGKPYVTTLELS